MQEYIINGLLIVVALLAVILQIIGTRPSAGMTKKQKVMLWRILTATVLLLILQVLGAGAFEVFGAAGRWVRLAVFLVDYLVIGYDIMEKAGKGIRNERRLRRPVGTPRTAQKRKHRHKDNQNFFHGNSILFTVVPHSPSPDTPPEAQHRIPRRTPDRRNLSGSALQAPKTDRRRYPQPDDKESGRQAEVCRPHALMLSRTYCEARVRRPVSPAPYSCPERDRKRRTG